jgi:hypothetical protein
MLNLAIACSMRRTAAYRMQQRASDVYGANSLNAKNGLDHSMQQKLLPSREDEYNN